jgi:hypothetical protein
MGYGRSGTTRSRAGLQSLTFQPLGMDLYGMNTPLNVLSKARDRAVHTAAHDLLGHKGDVHQESFRGLEHDNLEGDSSSLMHLPSPSELTTTCSGSRRTES